jgi:hypothetical protein
MKEPTYYEKKQAVKKERELRIRDLFAFKPLALWEEIIKAESETVPIELTEPVLDKSCLVGIEVEVENLEYFPQYKKLWEVTEDGSLRNNGREYISAPIKGPMIEYAVKRLFRDLSAYKYKFTPRCSIHVHMNARTMTAEQVYGMMLVYLVFEKTLFRFVGGNRENNIHCVPIRDCNLLRMFKYILSGKCSPEMWMKYTAVNLVPLKTQGTIEFRHMVGTDDVKKILTWINLLLKIKLFCYKRTLASIKGEVCALNTNSEYLGFFSRVFEEYQGVLQIDQKEMEEGVSLIKLIVESSDYLDSLKSMVPHVKHKLEMWDDFVQPTPVPDGLTVNTQNINNLINYAAVITAAQNP